MKPPITLILTLVKPFLILALIGSSLNLNASEIPFRKFEGILFTSYKDRYVEFELKTVQNKDDNLGTIRYQVEGKWGEEFGVQNPRKYLKKVKKQVSHAVYHQEEQILVLRDPMLQKHFLIYDEHTSSFISPHNGSLLVKQGKLKAAFKAMSVDRKMSAQEIGNLPELRARFARWMETRLDTCRQSLSKKLDLNGRAQFWRPVNLEAFKRRWLDRSLPDDHQKQLATSFFRTNLHLAEKATLERNSKNLVARVEGIISRLETYRELEADLDAFRSKRSKFKEEEFLAAKQVILDRIHDVLMNSVFELRARIDALPTSVEGIDQSYQLWKDFYSHLGDDLRSARMSQEYEALKEEIAAKRNQILEHNEDFLIEEMNRSSSKNATHLLKFKNKWFNVPMDQDSATFKRISGLMLELYKTWSPQESVELPNDFFSSDVVRNIFNGYSPRNSIELHVAIVHYIYAANSSYGHKQAHSTGDLEITKELVSYNSNMLGIVSDVERTELHRQQISIDKRLVPIFKSQTAQWVRKDLGMHGAGPVIEKIYENIRRDVYKMVKSMDYDDPCIIQLVENMLRIYNKKPTIQQSWSMWEKVEFKYPPTRPVSARYDSGKKASRRMQML